MGWFTRDKRSAGKSSAVRSLDEQLDILASCGIQLAEGVDRRELARGLSPSTFEADPFRVALVRMGQPRQSGSGEAGSGFLSNDVWHFDTECIEDSGAYVWLALRLAELAQGDLPLQAVEDAVDIESGEAWIQFTLDGQVHKWEAAVEGDWVDPTILGRFAELLAARTAGRRRFTYIDAGGGQDCLIGCSTPEQLERLREQTGLDVTWLT